MNTLKIRIAVQRIDENGYKHIHNVMLETESEEEVIKKIREALKKEIKEGEDKLIKWIASRQKNYIEKIISETDDDLIDWETKGKDISKREYLENEIFFETRG